MSTAVASSAPSLGTAFRRLGGGASLSLKGMNKDYFAQSQKPSRPSAATGTAGSTEYEETDSDEDVSEDEEEEEGEEDGIPDSVSHQTALSVPWVNDDPEEKRIVMSLGEHQLPKPGAYRSSSGFDQDLYETDLERVIRSAVENERNDLWRRVVNSSEGYRSLAKELNTTAPSLPPKSAIKKTIKEFPDRQKVQIGRISFHPSVVTSVLDRDDTIRQPLSHEFGGTAEGRDICLGGVARVGVGKAVASRDVRMENRLARLGAHQVEDDCMSQSVAMFIGEPMVPIAESTMEKEYPHLAKYGTSTAPKVQRRYLPTEGTATHKTWTEEEKACKEDKYLTTEEMGQTYPDLLTALTKSGADSIGERKWLYQWKLMTQQGQSVMLTSDERATMKPVLESSKYNPAREKDKAELKKTQCEQMTRAMDPEAGLKVAEYTMEELFSDTPYGKKLRESTGLEADTLPDAGESWAFQTKAAGNDTLINLRKANKYFPLLSKWPMNKVAQDRCESQAVTGINSYAEWATEYATKYKRKGAPTVVLTTEQKSEYDRITKSSRGVNIAHNAPGCTGDSCADHCSLHGSGLRKHKARNADGSTAKQRWKADAIASWWDTTNQIAHEGTGLLLPNFHRHPHLSKTQRAKLYGMEDRSNGTTGVAGTQLPEWTRQGDYSGRESSRG